MEKGSRPFSGEGKEMGDVCMQVMEYLEQSFLFHNKNDFRDEHLFGPKQWHNNECFYSIVFKRTHEHHVYWYSKVIEAL